MPSPKVCKENWKRMGYSNMGECISYGKKVKKKKSKTVKRDRKAGY
tara:strand:+ start:1434 stop:1571 length:138 start_codon:yes stop_codon:yes gene_type:complete